ncbi:MAG: tetratricopeptide repeat protein [candidate division WOR-3 bacterium]
MNLLLYVIILFIIIWLGLAFFFSTPSKIKNSKYYNIYLKALETIIEGKKDKAIKLFREVIETEPSNIESYLYIGNILREKGEVKKAIKIHRNLSVNPLLTKEQKRKLNEALAWDYIESKEWEKALPLLEVIYTKEPKNLEIANNLLKTYEKLEKWDKALNIAEKIFDAKKFANYATYLAEVIFQTDPKKALKLLSIGEREEISYAYYLHGKLLIKDGAKGEGAEYVKRGIALEPTKSFLYLPLLEEYMFNEGKFSTLEPYLKNKFEENPENINIFISYLSILKRKGKLEKAKEILENSIKNFNLEDPTTLLLLTMISDEIKDETMKTKCLMKIKERIEKNIYRCSECNSEIKEFTWKCPSCDSFGSLRPTIC